MPPKLRNFNTRSTKSSSKTEDYNGNFPSQKNESNNLQTTLLEDQNKGSNKSIRKKQSDDWRKDAQVNNDNPDVNSNRIRSRLNSSYQRYIPPNKKTDSKNEIVKPRSAPTTTTTQIRFPSTPASREKDEDERVIYLASNRQTNATMDVKTMDENEDHKIGASYDEVMFEREKLDIIELMEKFIFKTDSALDLDDLAVIDEKFLKGIDITGYVDEVFQ